MCLKQRGRYFNHDCSPMIEENMPKKLYFTQKLHFLALVHKKARNHTEYLLIFLLKHTAKMGAPGI